MASLTYPDRIYLFSDTFGGHKTWDPLRSPDMDAQMVTDVRSRIPQVHSKFDIFGAASQDGKTSVTDHILRTAVRLHDAVRDAGMTGIFINSAPRTTQGSNGKPFYLAETDNGVRIVATPLEALSAIKSRIVRLHHLPNENNELYSEREQFRSSFTVVLLANGHEQKLIEDDLAEIPDYPEGCHVAYIDRFGNMVLHEERRRVEGHSNILSNIGALSGKVGERVRITIGMCTQEATVGVSLAEADPGDLSVYPNDGNIDIMAKWAPGLQPEHLLDQSAFGRFKYPRIGQQAIVHV